MIPIIKGNYVFVNSRCNYLLGNNSDAISDAQNAVERKSDSLIARETLGRALYAAGKFEKALVEFHSASRLTNSSPTFLFFI